MKSIFIQNTPAIARGFFTKIKLKIIQSGNILLWCLVNK